MTPQVITGGTPPAPAAPAWLTGVRVSIGDDRGRRLQHLGHLTFSSDDTFVAPYRLVAATFTINDTLTLTTTVMAYPRDQQARTQVFSFADAEPDVLGCLQALDAGGVDD